MSLDDGLGDGFAAAPPVREVRPPRYVPTLTEVVSEGRLPPAPLEAFSPAPVPASDTLAPETLEPAPPADDEERLLRVLQRVEVLLDRRLSAAVAQAAESVSREFAQRLKADMEPLIREAVSEAVAAELNPANHPPP